MKQIIQTGKTVEEAVEKACEQLHINKQECTFEVLRPSKKSFFGLFKSPATVKVTVTQKQKMPPKTSTNNMVQKPPIGRSVPQQNTRPKPEKSPVQVNANMQIDAHAKTTADAPVNNQAIAQEIDKLPNQNDQKQAIAVSFVTRVMEQMGLADIKITEKSHENGLTLMVQSSQIGLLIGRRGETLDALQFLTNIACNRLEGKYFKVRINCGDYRSKRELALRELALKIGKRVAQTGESELLEPMNAYERRVIHAKISSIKGVNSKSRGVEPNRKVQIFAISSKTTPVAEGQAKVIQTQPLVFSSTKQSTKPVVKKNVPVPEKEMTIEEIIKKERLALAQAQKQQDYEQSATE